MPNYLDRLTSEEYGQYALSKSRCVLLSGGRAAEDIDKMEKLAFLAAARITDGMAETQQTPTALPWKFAPAELPPENKRILFWAYGEYEIGVRYSTLLETDSHTIAPVDYAWFLLSPPNKEPLQ